MKQGTTSTLAIVAVILLGVLAGCTSETATLGSIEAAAPPEPSATPAPAVSPNAEPDPVAPDAPEATDPTTEESAPVPYLPAGRPGDAAAYAAMIDRLEADIPLALQGRVPWPDLRNPNPIAAQTEIFDLWIWMAANHPEPRLVEVMAAPGSPSREAIAGIFGEIARENVFERRPGQGYEAFDHRVVTFESAGLPLWLSRDVPDDAVVVYYRDRSGAVEVTDQDTGALRDIEPPIPTRAWLSIMVPTDVGWQLWRDQLIETTDAELEFPEVPPPPGPGEQTRKPSV